MKTTLSFATPAELETESLVAVVLDHAEKDGSTKNQSASDKKEKPQLKLATSDGAVQSAAADLLASGELAGKCNVQANAGAVLRIETPGGGGWGTAD